MALLKGLRLLITVFFPCPVFWGFSTQVCKFCALRLFPTLRLFQILEYTLGLLYIRDYITQGDLLICSQVCVLFSRILKMLFEIIQINILFPCCDGIFFQNLISFEGQKISEGLSIKPTNFFLVFCFNLQQVVE